MENQIRIQNTYKNRPYMILKEENGLVYAFKTIPYNKYHSKLDNNVLLVRGRNDYCIVILDRVYLLSKNDFFGSSVVLDENDRNMLFKKLQVAAVENVYPEEVCDYINSQDTVLGVSDLIVHQGSLYVIIKKALESDNLYCLRVSKEAFVGALTTVMGGTRCFVDINDVHSITPDETTHYRSVLGGFNATCYDMDEESMKEYLEIVRKTAQYIDGRSIVDDVNKYKKLGLGMFKHKNPTE